MAAAATRGFTAGCSRVTLATMPGGMWRQKTRDAPITLFGRLGTHRYQYQYQVLNKYFSTDVVFFEQHSSTSRLLNLGINTDTRRWYRYRYRYPTLASVSVRLYRKQFAPASLSLVPTPSLLLLFFFFRPSRCFPLPLILLSTVAASSCVVPTSSFINGILDVAISQRSIEKTQRVRFSCSLEGFFFNLFSLHLSEQQRGTHRASAPSEEAWKCSGPKNRSVK